MSMSVLAVDLGGTKTATALVDRDGRASDERRVAAARTLEQTAAQIAEAAEQASAIGVIVPGIYTPETGRAWCPNLWGTDEVPLRAALAAHVGLPVAIDSDRAGYVLGEAWLGAARGCRDALYVALGTGIGVGILAGGRVLRGRTAWRARPVGSRSRPSGGPTTRARDVGKGKRQAPPSPGRRELSMPGASSQQPGRAIRRRWR